MKNQKPVFDKEDKWSQIDLSCRWARIKQLHITALIELHKLETKLKRLLLSTEMAYQFQLKNTWGCQDWGIPVGKTADVYIMRLQSLKNFREALSGAGIDFEFRGYAYNSESVILPIHRLDLAVHKSTIQFQPMDLIKTNKQATAIFAAPPQEQEKKEEDFKIASTGEKDE